jgi:hypothetical protein
VCAAAAEDVDVETVGFGEEQVGLVRDECEAFEEADADTAVRHNLCEREGSRLDIVTAFDNLEVWCDGAKVLVGLLVCEVAEAQRLSNLARSKELLEL